MPSTYFSADGNRVLVVSPAAVYLYEYDVEADVYALVSKHQFELDHPIASHKALWVADDALSFAFVTPDQQETAIFTLQPLD